MSNVHIEIGRMPTLPQIIALYQSSGLGARRPIDDENRLAMMYGSVNLIVTAWDGENCVGVARCTTDNAWFCYVADLMVAAPYQKLGLGRALLKEVHEAAGGTERVSLILEAAPGAEGFYEKCGLQKSGRSYIIQRTVNPPGYG
ncbi:MAG: GNAT family N-acetyltransferase [Alphaproteobacteria bacterium]|nr:GNAT family N-acetyltransferase [Alphaproteobacteria bacterium]